MGLEQLGARSQNIVNKVKVNKVHTTAELQKMLREARRVIARQAVQLSVQERELAVLRVEAAAARGSVLQRDDKEEEEDESEELEEESGSSEGGGGGGEAAGEGREGERRVVAWKGKGGGGRGGKRVEEERWCEARFLCPVSGRLMRNPTILADGITYEESVATRYVSGSDAAAPRSPMTGELLAHAELTPNTFVRMLIQRACPVSLDTLPPSVSLTLFPCEPELELLLLLDAASLCRLACTCKHFRVAASQEEVWKALLLAESRFNLKAQDLYGELFKVQYQTLHRGRKKPELNSKVEGGFRGSGLTLLPSRGR